MVTHFSSNGLDSACGRSSQTLVSTAVTEDVSCKSCQRSLVKADAPAASKNKTPSLAELRKTAKVAAAPAVAQVQAKPARSGGFSVKSAWAARLAEQGDRCRLPRGKVKQRHV
ncbi:hypothetical protein [Pseudomonas sp. PSKL.D1]|uniref:hypothetical protein n=1 Tax=Pseudomonas sp. PSKL.D1 TaxID=3029060 RepID=UPI00238125F0|nr:hypothetical protein [Pseudomonas sp. PSKL.D1]WDY57341.1 hypothetical protein PVV54_22615 [Pseudomonas sp. PSKL.D1]